MPLNIRSTDHLNPPTEETGATISQSTESPSDSAQGLQARIDQQINKAVQNFDQIAGAARAFTTETDGTITTIKFDDGTKGSRPSTFGAEVAGYRTGLGKAGNRQLEGLLESELGSHGQQAQGLANAIAQERKTQDSQLAGLLESELGGHGQQAQELADAIAQGGQAGTALAEEIAQMVSSNGADESNQTGTQGSTGDPVATADPVVTGDNKDNDFSALIEHEKIRRIKP